MKQQKNELKKKKQKKLKNDNECDAKINENTGKHGCMYKNERKT